MRGWYPLAQSNLHARCGASLQQQPRLHAKCCCNTFDIVDRNVAGLAFNVADIAAVQPAFVGKRFLRPPEALAEADDVQGKCFAYGLARAGHKGEVQRMTTMRRPTISDNPF